jgi:hypothetical protein
MRWTILIGVGVVLGGVLLYRVSAGDTDSDGWVKFSSPEGRFEILMPGRPIVGKVIEIPLPKFTAEAHPFVAVRPPFGIMCGYADLPFKPENTSEIFDHTRDGSIHNVHGTLITEKNIFLNGYPGRRFRSTAQDSSFIDEEVFVVGRRFYLITIDSKANPPDKNIDRVFDSFRFTPLSDSTGDKTLARTAHDSSEIFPS